MKQLIVLSFIFLSLCVAASPKDKGEKNKNVYTRFSTPKSTGVIDLADVELASNKYLPKNYIYTYKEAITTKKKLEDQLSTEPSSLGIRWALMRYYVSASNFVGGSSAKAIEQARHIYEVDDYIGCMAFEFVYTRLHKFDKAEEWYRRSLIITQQRPNVDLMDITYNKTVLLNVKASGSFNSDEPNHLYEGNDGSYSRRVMMAKNKSTAYKLLVDYRTTVERN